LLRLKGRYYRTIPITDPGYQEEDLQLEAGETALVAMHCWNIGFEGGPPIDPDYWVGMGFPVAHEEAGRIIIDLIRPAMDAAREAGVLVCHVESETIRKNREAGFQESSRSEDREPKIWREKIAWRSHGVDYPSRSPLSRMDRVKLVQPLEGEPFVCTTGELQEILVERGIRNLIYSGFATDMCVLRAPGGVEPMAARDYRMFLLRDATVGVECPDTFDERLATRWAIRYFETHFGDTMTTRDFINACKSS
jgi:nicotinamidase-related amidase